MPYYLFTIKSKSIGFMITRDFSIPLSNMGRNKTIMGNEIFVSITMKIKSTFTILFLSRKI